MFKVGFVLVLISSMAFSQSLQSNRPLTAKDAEIKTSDWYNADWYKLGTIKGLLYISKFVKKMHADNLYLTNEDFVQNKKCNDNDVFVRSIDGSCNDLKLPLMGATDTYFSRNMPVDLSRMDLNKSQEVDPRLISRELITREEFKKAKYFNFLGAAFFQFVVHDWFSHENDYDQMEVLRLSDQDPLKINHGQNYMAYFKTRVAAKDQKGILYHKNKTTHWFDGSQVYGSDQKTSDSLRTFENGQLKIVSGGLPLDSKGQEMAGNTDNWWVGLSIIHGLFVKEHNHIALELKRLNPKWSDQKLFDKARLINSALITKLFLTEMGEPRFQSSIVNMQLKSNWYGIVNALTQVKSKGTESDLSPGWEKLFLGQPLLTGFAGSKRNLNGYAFSMSEEWAVVYRYHQILPDTLEIRDENNQLLETRPVEKTRGREGYDLVQKYGHDQMLKMFATQHAGQVVLNNKPKFMSELEIPVLGRIDIGALDIIRERERGIPKFNQFRRHMGLKPYSSFLELTRDAKTAQKLANVYPNIESMDTTIGLVAEFKPDGYELGETQSLILSLAAVRRLQADRFYTTQFNDKTYTKFGMNWINTTTMNKLIVRHHPSLAKALKNVKNPFAVWTDKVQNKMGQY